jgi:hypothetical protein
VVPRPHLLIGHCFNRTIRNRRWLEPRWHQALRVAPQRLTLRGLGPQWNAVFGAYAELELNCRRIDPLAGPQNRVVGAFHSPPPVLRYDKPPMSAIGLEGNTTTLNSEVCGRSGTQNKTGGLVG